MFSWFPVNKFYCENISLKRSQSVKKSVFKQFLLVDPKFDIWFCMFLSTVWESFSMLTHLVMKPLLYEAGWKWCIHRATGACSTDSSCPINDQHTALNPFLYVVLLWGLLAFFPPLIQLFWMTIMWFRHCLLFNYRTYLSLKHATLACKAPLYN